MLSKVKLKYIKSLQVKKYRKEEQCFVVEGAKSVAEVINSDFDVVSVLATSAYLEGEGKRLAGRKVEVTEVSGQELVMAGSLQTNDAALAVVRMKPNLVPAVAPDEFALVLDDIRDPGNLGTIIRTADWYGIRNIVASAETADLYNSKTVIASMGSFTRVHLFYTNLLEYLGKCSGIYGTFLQGEDVRETSFEAGGYIVIGNESNGISEEIEKLVQHRIRIPRFGNAESLNAGVATAIVLDNLRRLQE